MKHRLKQTLTLLLVFALAAALAACGGSGSETGAPGTASTGANETSGAAGRAAAENVINIAFTTAWGDFDPYYSTSGTMYELALYDKIYDKLVFTDMAGAEILPRAATSWESADDGLSAVFHLNENAAWSDGEPVTADDWVFTVRLLADPDVAFSTRVFTQTLAGTDDNGVAADPDVLGAAAVDAHTLKLTFKEVTDPEDFLIHYNRQFLVLPAHLLGDVNPAELLNADFWKNPVGSGPCVYVSQVLGSEMILAPNPNYHLGTGNWDKLVLRVLDSSNVLTSLMSGDIDHNELGSGVSADNKPVAESGGLTVRDAEVRDFFLEVLINENTVSDASVRQALHYAIDKDAIVAASAKDVGTPAYNYELTNSDYYNSDVVFSRDVEKARSLLAEVGYDGRKYKIAFASKRENVAALLTQQWAEAGINVEMIVVDVATMFSGLADGTYDLGISGHSATAYALWFEAEFPANDNPAPDPVREDYVARISTTVEHSEKVALVKEYEQYLFDQAYFIPLYFSGDFWVESPRVSGIRNSASLMCNDNVWEWNVKVK